MDLLSGEELPAAPFSADADDDTAQDVIDVDRCVPDGIMHSEENPAHGTTSRLREIATTNVTNEDDMNEKRFMMGWYF